MALDYDIQTHLAELSPVLDEHAEWFGRVMRWTFYPALESSRQPLRAPQSFHEWVDRTDAVYDPVLLTKLTTLHEELHRAASVLIARGHQTGKPPEIELMDSFLTHYEEFILQIRRLERDCIRADRGIDDITGLRSADVMKRDVARELERRARRGRPFCLVIVRIDGRADLKKKNTPESFTAILRVVTDSIKVCIRSYDDAYHMEDGEFVLNLKHSDLSGTLAAIRRLSNILDEKEHLLGQGKDSVSLSLSYGIAEPMPGDDPSELLARLRQDLDVCAQEGEKGAIVQYFEVSPLQMYIEKFAEKKKRAESENEEDNKETLK